MSRLMPCPQITIYQCRLGNQVRSVRVASRPTLGGYCAVMYGTDTDRCVFNTITHAHNSTLLLLYGGLQLEAIQYVYAWRGRNAVQLPTVTGYTWREREWSQLPHQQDVESTPPRQSRCIDCTYIPRQEGRICCVYCRSFEEFVMY